MLGEKRTENNINCLKPKKAVGWVVKKQRIYRKWLQRGKY